MKFYQTQSSRFLFSLFTLAILFSLLAAGCKKDDDDPENPDDHNHEEVITRLTLTLTDSADQNNSFTAVFSDPDGTGGNGPTIFDDINLNANSTYIVAVTLADESDGHVHDITSEIRQEDHEHLLCYTAAGVDISVERTDSDGTFPVGLGARWRTGAAGTGTMTVTLKHQPEGTKDGTCTPGETDIEVAYTTTVN